MMNKFSRIIEIYCCCCMKSSELNICAAITDEN